MASKSQVTLTFAGDSTDLERAFSKVGAAADEMAGEVDRATRDVASSAERFDAVGEGAGAVDQRAMGFRDTITGVQDTMKALSDESMSTSDRLFTLGAGVGDLASGVENLVAPLAKAALEHSKAAATWVANHARMLASAIMTATRIAVTWAVNAAKAAASVVMSVARQVAAWALLGVQSLIHAAKVAAAWIISMGPIALVIAAVVGLVIIIIKNWDHIVAAFEWAYEWLKSATSAAWDFIKGIFQRVFDAIAGIVTWYIDTYKRVIGAAWDFLKTATSAAWDAIKATFSRVFESIAAVVRFYIDTYKRVIGAAWDFLKTITRTAFDGIKRTITTIMTAVKTAIRTQIDLAVGIFRGLAGRLRTALSAVAGAITAPFRTGFAEIKNLWNRLVGGKGFSVPSWVPGVGGREFRIPKLAQGGIIPATPGGMPFIGGEAGEAEAVIPLSKLSGMTGGGTTTIQIVSDGTAMGDVLVEVLRKSIANRGGGVVKVLG